MKPRAARVTAERWVRVEGVIEPIVDPALFREAQAVVAGWSTRISSEAALDMLRALLARHGKLSATLINAAEGMPKQHFYDSRFGGLTRAYALVGFFPTRDYAFLDGYTRRCRRLEALREDIAEQLRRRGVDVRRESRVVLGFAGLRVAVMLTRCRRPGPPPRWRVQTFKVTPLPDWVLTAGLNAEGTAVERYWLTPATRIINLGTRDWRHRDRHEAASPEALLDLIAGGRRPAAPFRPVPRDAPRGGARRGQCPPGIALG